LDIGGTNMVAGAIDVTGKVITRQSAPTDPHYGHEEGLKRIAALIEQTLNAANLKSIQTVGIGIGSTGPIDTDTGIIHNPYTLPSWDGLPVGRYLTEHFAVPTYLLIDTQVAVLGEHWVGAAEAVSNTVYITVGTGIGSGLILGGKLHHGVKNLAGEVGHQVIDPNGPDCYCGAKGCWEMLAAAPAMAKYAAEHVPPESKLLELAEGDRKKITPKLISQAAQEGDSFAQSMMEREAVYLGTGVANVINILAPEVVVMGGGVMQSWSAFAPTLLDTVRKRSGMIPFDRVRIVPAALGLNAGIIGAARAIFARQSGDPIL
jgi:glucokinase